MRKSEKTFKTCKNNPITSILSNLNLIVNVKRDGSQKKIRQKGPCRKYKQKQKFIFLKILARKNHTPKSLSTVAKYICTQNSQIKNESLKNVDFFSNKFWHMKTIRYAINLNRFQTKLRDHWTNHKI